MATLTAKLSLKRNALKHGAFAKTAILPGEDPIEFLKLHADLIAEWAPEGPSEHDCVLTIAKAKWRKDRLQKFLHAKTVGCTYDPQHVLFDEARGLVQFYQNVKSEPESFTRRLNCISEEHANHLRQDFFPERFNSVAEWDEALRKEIFTVLVPKTEDLNEAHVDALLDRSARVVSPEVFENEISTDAALDAVIDRATRRLAQIKTTKEVLGLTPQAADTPQVKRVPRRKALPGHESRLRSKDGAADE